MPRPPISRLQADSRPPFSSSDLSIRKLQVAIIVPKPSEACPLVNIQKNYGKSPRSMGKSIIPMAIFNSKLLNYQRVCPPALIHCSTEEGYPLDAKFRPAVSSAFPAQRKVVITGAQAHKMERPVLATPKLEKHGCYSTIIIHIYHIPL